MPMALAIVSLLAIYSADAGFGSFLKKVGSGLKAVATAPFKLAGSIVGPGVKAAVDPALDGAFDRARQTADYAAGRFGSEFETKGKELIKELDKVAETRLTQVDTILKNRLDQVDTILDKRLHQYEDISKGLLERQAQILDHTLTKTDVVLQRNISEIGKISERSLTKIQQIESDALDRLEATIQDQVPFAATQVVRDLQFLAVVIIPLVVVLCVAAASLLRGVKQAAQAAAPAGLKTQATNIWKQLHANFGTMWRRVVTVGVPVAIVAIVVHLGFVAYYWQADSTRLRRITTAAQMFEKVGDFSEAMKFRRRAFALKSNGRNLYHLQRDKFLALFAQSALRPNLDELAVHLRYLAAC